MEVELVWETVVNHEDYEICRSFPHQIRKKENQRVIHENVRKSGYIHINVNSKSFLKHRIIAIQFIPNPDNLPEVDHKNRIKCDNRIENLRWATGRENQLNKKSHRGIDFEYFDDLPVPCQPFIFYNGHDF
jgi:hypothetical protein